MKSMTNPVGRPRIYPSVICEKCGKEVGATAINRHMKTAHGKKGKN